MTSLTTDEMYDNFDPDMFEETIQSSEFSIIPNPGDLAWDNAWNNASDNSGSPMEELNVESPTPSERLSTDFRINTFRA